MESVVKTLRDGEIMFFDATGTPLTMLLALEEGDLQFQFGGAAVDQILDRGALSHVRPGKEAPVKGSFSCLFREFIRDGSNNISPYEICYQVGAAAAWVSTNTDGGGVYTFGLKFTVRSSKTGEQDERITFAKCYVEPGDVKFSEGSPNKLSIAFTDFELKPTIIKVGEGS